MVLKPLNSKSAPFRFQGCIDEVLDGNVKGWCIDADALATPVFVDVVVDGIVVASARAELSRPDLFAAGLGTNIGGFELLLPSTAGDCEILIVPRGSDVPLARIPPIKLAPSLQATPASGGLSRSQPIQAGPNTNPRRTPVFWSHRDHLVETVNLTKSFGLEIGAMDLPFVESGEGNCDFADFRTTDELREEAGRIAGHNPEFVIDVTYNLRHGYEDITRTYDWIAASHVVEHVPDLISWFDNLHSKLKEGGVLFLVVPDKRFTFDYHRNTTNLADVVSAHQQKLRTPSFRQVFDHYFYTTNQIDPAQIWQGVHPGPAFRNYLAALARAENALATFEDAHCSVFTPESFNELMNELTGSGLVAFRMETLRPTPLYHLDFTVILRRI
jgi:methyltransferase family protein